MKNSSFNLIELENELQDIINERPSIANINLSNQSRPALDMVKQQVKEQKKNSMAGNKGRSD